MKVEKHRFYLKFLLWIFVLHTTGVAAGLCLLPTAYLVYFGFEGYQGHFFQAQAGIFHLVMGVAYLLALFYGEKSPALIFFAVFAKSMAAVFLMIYYFFFEQYWIFLFSALGDGMLGLSLLLIYTHFVEYKQDSKKLSNLDY